MEIFLVEVILNGIVIGLVIIIGYHLVKLIGLSAIADTIGLISTLIGITIIIVMAQKYDHNKKKKT